MAMIAITAVFDSRRKAEEAVTQLSQIGLTDVFIKTSRYLPDFSFTGAGSLSFFSGDTHDFDLTTVTGSMPEARAQEANRVIEQYGGMKGSGR